MPSSLLGELLDGSTPEPLRGIDVTALLQRSRSRRRTRAVLAMVVAVATAAGLVVGAQALDTGTRSVGPVATKPPSPPPTQRTSDPSPTLPPAPDVIGMDVDAALVALQQGECMGRELVVHNAAPVGRVVAQATADALCEVTLTVSAGPAASAPLCNSVAVTAGQVGIAAGHAGFPVVVRNTGSALCGLQGYPDVTATESHTGKSVVARHTPDGYIGTSGAAVSSYLLRPGDHVSAVVEGTDNPVGNARTCTQLYPFQITVNGFTATLDRSLNNCGGIEVHRFVPGATGSVR